MENNSQSTEVMNAIKELAKIGNGGPGLVAVAKDIGVTYSTLHRKLGDGSLTALQIEQVANMFGLSLAVLCAEPVWVSAMAQKRRLPKQV